MNYFKTRGMPRPGSAWAGFFALTSQKPVIPSEVEGPAFHAFTIKRWLVTTAVTTTTEP